MIPGIRAREPRAIARAISLVENQDPRADALLTALHPETGRAMTLGVTGPPGAGKSTFVDRLVSEIAQSGRRVAVVAVDPASPFSGGAILGDRVRMGEHPGVYFRSMSSRGHLGGLALATEGAVSILDAAGFNVVIVETVGVGQSEIEVAELADTTLLVQPPHLGDGVQAVKAGIMEVPAVFVLNKADLPGARQAANEIKQMLDLGDRPADAWKPPVLLASATAPEDTGVAAIWEAIQRHWTYLREHDRLQAARARRAERLLWKEAERLLAERLRRWSQAHPGEFEAIAKSSLPPRQAAQRMIDAFEA
ncbi:MAG TPA: methylmalonyl Co-A mutase-associated GTPase MeaB [Oscillatoriaceae cyanobacterium]